jgi:hypothetical protein
MRMFSLSLIVRDTVYLILGFAALRSTLIATLEMTSAPLNLHTRAMQWRATTGPLVPGRFRVLPESVHLRLMTVSPSRRICPGINVAERILFLAISRLLWAFAVHEVPGEPISLEEYEGTSGRTPVPYRVHLLPRHEGVHAALETEQEILHCDGL